MIPKECNIIGKGGHWVVERILVNDNGQKYPLSESMANREKQMII